MGLTKPDVRQAIDRATLDRITGLANSQLDTILAALNKEITPPFAMNQTAVADLVLHIGSRTVINPTTLINRTIAPISGISPSFSSGTVTFPSSSGGNATPSVGSAIVITVASGNFIKVGISLDSQGNIMLNTGVEGASAAAATVPPLVSGTFTIGYALLHNVSGTIQNITNDAIFQYVAGSSGSGSGTGEKNYIKNPDDALTNWIASGAGITVANDTTGSELPEESKRSGIKITPVSGSDYVYTRFTIDDADKNKKLKIFLNIKTDSGYASDDLEIQVWTNTLSDYTGTAAQLTLDNDPGLKKSDAGGSLGWSVDTDSSDFYEVRIKRNAGTSFAVVSGVLMGPGARNLAPAIGSWAHYTPTFVGFGTPSNIDFIWRRVGQNMEIQGSFETGTLTGVPGTISLPLGLHYDTTLLEDPASASPLFSFGEYTRTTSSTQYIYTAVVSGVLIYTAATGSQVLQFAPDVSGGKYQTENANSVFTTGEFVEVRKIIIPIAEWRGTGTLNVLQEDNLSNWMSYTPSITAAAGTPNVSSTTFKWRRVGDSMEIHGNITLGGTGTGGDLQASIPAGYTIDTALYPLGSSAPIGSATFYQNPKFYIGLPTTYTSTTLGFNLSYNSADSSGSTIKFIQGSDGAAGNQLEFSASVKIVEFKNSQNSAVGFSEVNANSNGLALATSKLTRKIVAIGSGSASVATAIVTFTTIVEDVGSDVTYVADTTNGDRFIINTSGVYAIMHTNVSTTVLNIGISRNASSLTTNIEGLSAAQALTLVATPANNNTASCFVTMYLVAGDIIRPHTTVGFNNGGNNGNARFYIQRLS